jgi:hypothetical protein
MNADRNPFPDPDKTARYESIYPVLFLLPSFRTDILAKFIVDFERRQKNKDGLILFYVSLFCQGQGKDKSDTRVHNGNTR